MKRLLIATFLLVASLFLGAHSAEAAAGPYLNGKYVGGDQVALWWSQVPGATSYQILYGPADNPQAHGVVLGSTTSYTVGALFKNVTYVFTVKAVNGGVTDNSNAVRVRTGVNARPALPSQPVASTVKVGENVDGKVITPAVSYNMQQDTMRSDATPNSPYISSGKVGFGLQNLRTSRGLEKGTINLHWNEPMVSDAGNYNVVYTDDQTVEKWGVLNIPSNLRSFTIRGLESGKRYYFWMSNERTGRTPWVSDIAR